MDDATPARRWRPRLLLLGLAAVVRLAYFFEYAQLPFLHGPLADSHVYLRQADAVAAGHFGDPTLLAMSPLYGYALALLSSNAVLVVGLQLALGVAVTALVINEVGHRFSESAGLAAGALYLGYGLIPFYETKLLSDALGLDLAALAFALYLRGGPRMAIGAGVTFALAVLARSSLVFAVPPLLLASVVPRAEEPRIAVARRAGAFAVGLLLVFGANMAWTYHHAGVAVPVIHTSSQDNVVARSSRATWTGDLSDVAIDEDAAIPGPWDRVRSVERALARGADDDMGGALRSIDLAGWIREAPSRTLATVSDIERSFQYGYYGERTVVRSLHLLPITVPALLALALVGAVLLVREEGWRALVPYLPIVLGVLAVTSLYHPSSRYRLPLVLPCVWLGGLALARLWCSRHRQWARWIAIACTVIATVTAVRGWTYELKSPAAWELTLAESHATAGSMEEARAHASRARRLAPHDASVERVVRHLGLEPRP